MRGDLPTVMVLDDRYELRPLTSGGMGEVWEGHDTRLKREVAVKFLKFPDGVHDEELVRRFLRESRVTARLQHPGVPAVFDQGTHEGRPYLVMQRIHGVTVSDLIAEEGALPIGWAAAIAAQVCAVLTAAHHASLVHRDLKPSNVMLEPEGTVKVLDFGLAVALDLSDFSQITRTGQLIGTPAYMAPEQIASGISSPRSDLYALGCTLYQMLAGQLPFTGATSYDTMNKQVSAPPPPLHIYRPEVPDPLADLVLHLLAKNPKDRPRSAQEVYERLLPFATGLVPLTGAMDPPGRSAPTRMYAAVVSRVDGAAAAPAESRGGTPFPGEAARQAVSGPAPADPQPAPGNTRVDRVVLKEHRAEAERLLAESRTSEAVDVVRSALRTAEKAFGALDSDVIDLRGFLADMLFNEGDYHEAASEFAVLAADLAQRDGPYADLVFHYRRREATCRTLVGDTTEALELMHRLLTDGQHTRGLHHPWILDLRRDIGTVQLQSQQYEEAIHTLRSLLNDLTQVYGPFHSRTVKVRALLEQATQNLGQQHRSS